MRNLPYLLTGIFFGIVLTKGEAISWYRMQEMFHFQGFHMYGIFMTAIPTGALTVWLLKRSKAKALSGENIVIPPKPFHKGVIIGGLIFGFGWALTGACPGPIYVQIGTGVSVMIIGLAFALAGTWTYGAIRDRLPH